MNKGQITENSYVMNTKTGKAYKVTTNTVQSRNRMELVGTGFRNPEITRVAESRLHPLSFPAAVICSEAERIIRWKEKQTPFEKQVMLMYRALRDSIVD